MYSLLVVDDEMIAVQGVTQGIDWTSTPVSQLFEAFSVESAKQILEQHKIDVMITDIEMPIEDGIQLMQWVASNYPLTKTIVLTGHAKFNYAQQAIELASFAYILKPVRHKHLQEVVLNALSEIQEEQELLINNDLFNKYYSLWNSQKPILIERFWQDIFSERVYLSEETFNRAALLYDLPPEAKESITLVLISVEQWDKEFNTRDEEIMEFALRNAAAEMIVKKMRGEVIQDRDGSILILIYGMNATIQTLDQLKQDCEQYIAACKCNLYCTLSCYIEEASPFEEILISYQRLQLSENDNITATGVVRFSQVSENTMAPKSSIPWFPEWLVLLELGKKNELLDRIDRMFVDMSKGETFTKEALIAMYHGMFYMIYYVFNKKGLSIEQLIHEKNLYSMEASTKSMDSLKNWMVQIVSKCLELSEALHFGSSTQIAKVRTYISNHLDREITREELASHVNLNSAYLSRLFKQETSKSLTDYILEVRMEKAKELLRNSNLKIAYIIEQIGFNQFSYFTKMFKKVVGITPQEYRKTNGT